MRAIVSLLIAVAFSHAPGAWELHATAFTSTSETAAIRTSDTLSPSQVAIESATVHLSRDGRVERRALLQVALLSAPTDLLLSRGSRVAWPSSTPARARTAIEQPSGRAPPDEASSLNS